MADRTRLMGRYAMTRSRVPRTFPVWDDAMLTEATPPGRSWGGVRLRLPGTTIAVTIAREGSPPWPSPARAIRNRWHHWRWVRAGRPALGAVARCDEADA